MLHVGKGSANERTIGRSNQNSKFGMRVYLAKIGADQRLLWSMTFHDQ